ncbi:imidazolonepropionase [Legionella dresdenensis]|uniref:Imidazolonepropionase n=1 Tax=Legionella dresdenensis TaxID=450200 RepID=A0ABV8CIR0_9GAMM
MRTVDTVLLNATTVDETGNELTNQALVIADGKFVWCGGQDQLPSRFLDSKAVIEDCRHHLVTPGLIDCHTHLVYAGNRADEFKLKLQGATYSEIAKAGGGILSTVNKTRAASDEELLEQSLPRALALKNEGVTTLEIKSGYGLDLANEVKMLRVARRLGELAGLRVRTTFLGAHAIPPEHKDNPQRYVDIICNEMLPAVVELKLVDAVDVFCESIAFSLKQTEQIFNQALALGLPIKCHAEQLTNLGAGKQAAMMGALSCEHLEYLDLAGAKAMAAQGTVAVLLPGAYYFLKEKQKPPIQLLREQGVGMAIATDCNPGSSPTTSLLLMMNMACQLFGFTVPEVVAATTTQAAKALGLDAEIGRLMPGFAADLVKWSVKDSASLCYYFGYPLSQRTMIAGKWVN